MPKIVYVDPKLAVSMKKSQSGYVDPFSTDYSMGMYKCYISHLYMHIDILQFRPLLPSAYLVYEHN